MAASSPDMATQVQMARIAANQGKRTMILAASLDRADAIRDEFGLIDHPMIYVGALDPMPALDVPGRAVTFVVLDDGATAVGD